MDCPYLTNQKETTQIRREYNDVGQEVFYECVEVRAQTPLKCGESQCAVYQNGKCGYYNDNSER